MAATVALQKNRLLPHWWLEHTLRCQNHGSNGCPTEDGTSTTLMTGTHAKGAILPVSYLKIFLAWWRVNKIDTKLLSDPYAILLCSDSLCSDTRENRQSTVIMPPILHKSNVKDGWIFYMWHILLNRLAIHRSPVLIAGLQSISMWLSCFLCKIPISTDLAGSWEAWQI